MPLSFKIFQPAELQTARKMDMNLFTSSYAITYPWPYTARLRWQEFLSVSSAPR
jgi:hypothetical protein